MFSLPPVYPIVDDTLLPLERMEEAARSIVDGGATILQLRAKSLSAADFLDAARSLRKVTEKKRVTFIINDRVDIALLSNADGVHLGQDDMPVGAVRRLIGPRGIIGLSTHNRSEAAAAERESVDYISFGPLFSTTTKGDAEKPKGLKALTGTRRSVAVPIVAIGGIQEEQAVEVVRAGADSVALISAILLADDMKGKVERLLALGAAAATAPALTKR